MLKSSPAMRGRGTAKRWRGRGKERWRARRAGHVNLAAAQRSEDEQLAAIGHARPDAVHRLTIHEYPHVPADTILFIDDSKSHPRISPIQIAQHQIDGGARRLDAARAGAIGLQLGGNEDADHGAGAATTE